MTKRQFWGIVGRNREMMFCGLSAVGVTLDDVQDVLEQTVFIACEAAKYVSSKEDASSEIADYLHDVRNKCIDSGYLNIGGAERK